MLRVLDPVPKSLCKDEVEAPECVGVGAVQRVRAVARIKIRVVEWVAGGQIGTAEGYTLEH